MDIEEFKYKEDENSDYPGDSFMFDFTRYTVKATHISTLLQKKPNPVFSNVHK